MSIGKTTAATDESSFLAICSRSLWPPIEALRCRRNENRQIAGKRGAGERCPDFRATTVERYAIALQGSDDESLVLLALVGSGSRKSGETLHFDPVHHWKKT